MSRHYTYALCLSRDYLQSISQLSFTDSVCSKQFWEQHATLYATQKMIIMMSTITLMQLMGIIPTTGTCRNCKDSLGGKVQVKYKQPYVLVVQSLCLQTLHPSEPGSRKVTSSASSAWSRLAISEPLQSKMYVFLGTA